MSVGPPPKIRWVKSVVQYMDWITSLKLLSTVVELPCEISYYLFDDGARAVHRRTNPRLRVAWGRS
ncbi:hypothetical protein [Methanopyrus sp.]